MVSTDHRIRPPGPSSAPESSFSVSFDDAAGCLTIAGELAHETAPVFAGVIAGQVAHHRVDLRLDLADVTFFDLPGFDALCAAQRHLEECGGRLRVVRAGRLLRVVADILGHESLFETSPALLPPPSGGRGPAPEDRADA